MYEQETAERASSGIKETPGDLRELEHHIEAMEGLVRRLHERLDPVLMPEIESPEQAMTMIQGPQSPLADRIDALRRVQTNLARLEMRISL